jgi:hypothetical protein
MNFGSGKALVREGRRVFLALSIVFAAFAGDPAFADPMCGQSEEVYLQKLLNGLQPYAQKVSASGKFITKEEHGNGGMAIRFSFIDQGKPQFSVRSPETGGEWAAIGARPGKTRSGQPGFSFYFNQGNTGACETSIFVKDGRFVHTPVRFVR